MGDEEREDQQGDQGADSTAEQAPAPGSETAEVAAPVEGEGDGGGETSEAPNWQARAEAAEAQNAKLQEDGRAQRLDRLTQRERDLALREVRDQNAIILMALKDQGYEGVEEGLQTMERGRAARASDETFTTESARVQTAVGKLETQYGVSVKDHPAFEDARRHWIMAHETGNLKDLSDALLEATIAAGKIGADQVKAAEASGKRQATEATKRANKAAGVHDLGSGGEAGGSGSNWRDRTTAAEKIASATDKDWAGMGL